MPMVDNYRQVLCQKAQQLHFCCSRPPQPLNGREVNFYTAGSKQIDGYNIYGWNKIHSDCMTIRQIEYKLFQQINSFNLCYILHTIYCRIPCHCIQYHSFVKILALLHMIESEGTVTVPNSALPVSNSISASSHVSDSGFQVSTFAHHLLQSKKFPPLRDNCRPCQSPQRREVVPQQKLLRAQTVAVPCRLLL